MPASQDKKNVFTIPASVPFLPALARHLLNKYSDAPHALTKVLILLPNRRACRALRDSFLSFSEGKPLLLPRLHPLGDIDEDELQMNIGGMAENELITPMPPLKRQILLARLIGRLPDYSKGMEQDMALAGALGRLMDEIHTENLSLSDLPALVDMQAFAGHWQITLRFLEILSEKWPQILSEEQSVDASAHRNELILALHHYWQASPPDFPVIAAGSTGSIPATAQLLKTISGFEQGCVILPGLDKYMDEEDWLAVEEGHPQATLKHLLASLEITRDQVDFFQGIQPLNAVREKFVSAALLPADRTSKWQEDHCDPEFLQALKHDISSIQRYDCKTVQEEALLVSLILRQSLEEPKKTAALVTPDRDLARRVAAHCRRWGIDIDDSAGQPLSTTGLGIYLRLAVQVCVEGCEPVSLLAFLKHDMTRIQGIKNYRSVLQRFEKDLLRGPAPRHFFADCRTRFYKKMEDDSVKEKPAPESLQFLEKLESSLLFYLTIFDGDEKPFAEYLKLHIKLAEMFCGQSSPWHGEQGEQASRLFAQLLDYADSFPPITGSDYLIIISNLMQTVTVRRKYGTHPRLQILGQLEGRLVQADRVILSGLNEGTWPADPGHDPWMSRPMRTQYGLPVPERSITLAAHDFIQGFCAGEVFITRPERKDGASTLPARWLQRMEVYLSAQGLDPQLLKGGPCLDWLKYLDDVETVDPVKRPAPCPPVEARPTSLSVTRIDAWRQDPYGIFARDILKLYKLDPVAKITDVADRGTLLHDTLQLFHEKYKTALPQNAAEEFLQTAENVIADSGFDRAQWQLWIPKLQLFAEDYVEYERNWRLHASPAKLEGKGELELGQEIGRDFVLRARVDRIDCDALGNLSIIDYKSGGTYSAKRIESGALAQLPLEALIAATNGFKGIRGTVNYIGYWKMPGRDIAVETTALDNEEKVSLAIENARLGLIALVQAYNDVNTPYLSIPDLNNSPRYNDYEHLARVKEWAALGESSEEAA
jgi:ATP-dependent helicase/nuclease subunit B